MLEVTGIVYRLLVAASVGQNPQGDSMTLHHTTLMPNLHGLSSLVCLIFSPIIELRYRTFLVALCYISVRDNNFEERA
jgi:hypothetical protein